MQLLSKTKKQPTNSPALVISGYGKYSQIQTSNQTLYTATRRKNVALPVAGDKVEYQTSNNNEVIITALLPRKNTLSRLNKPVAANIDYLLLVVCLSPKYRLDLIDRYLIVANMLNIPIKILVNKIDLTNDLAPIKSDFQAFVEAGYDLNYFSLNNKQGTDLLLADLDNQTYLIVGQSGVGKSSLINFLMPDLDLKTQAISNNQEGKHTTSNTILYPLNNGAIIDSPGVREFELDDLTALDIQSGFVEIHALSQGCKFRNCIHINEPKCAVKIALEAGILSTRRYKSYAYLMSSAR